MNINEGIRKECIDECMICGKRGVLLYKEMGDKLFGVGGIWALFCCLADDHVWLNPRPTQEDIEKVYTNYYTHNLENERYSFLISLKNIAESVLLESEFRYEGISNNKVGFLKKKGIGFIPMVKEIVGSKVMWLEANPGGNLLDIGCGNGNFLNGMKALGWNVSGVEPDVNAAKIATDRVGVPVSVGTLKEANFPDNYFDAITANHVIEHMHDPIGCLKESFRILKPGGKLVLTTPNIKSWGHRVFGKSWRDLDVPRHLHLFSPYTVKICVERAGYTLETLRTTARSTWEIWCASFLIKKEGGIQGSLPNNLSPFYRLSGLLVQLVQHIMRHLWENIGEGIILIATKPRH